MADNTSPVEAINEGLLVTGAGLVPLTSDDLLYGDAEQPDSAILFTITTAATGGALYMNGVALGLGDSFTQDDIDAGLVGWQSDGTSGQGSFGFQVTDGAGGYVGGKTFTVRLASALELSTLTPDQGRVDAYVEPTTTVGDLDGDGYEELLSGGAGSTRNAEFYFRWGSESGYADVANYPAMTADQGFVVARSHDSGAVARPIGDVNGDGYDDLGFAPSAHYDLAGYVAVIFGGPRPLGTINEYDQDIINLESLSSSDGFILRATGADRMNFPAAIGDINGDGIDDFAAGAFNASLLHTYSGAVYVMYGTTGSFGTPSGGTTTIGTDEIAPAQGFVISGPHYGRVYRTHEIGDINGDGYGDFVISSAQSYVIFGGPEPPGDLVDGQRVLDLVNLTPDQGFVIDATGEAWNFTNAGDFNGDGIEDLLVGIANPSGDYAGGAYVLFGSTDGFGNVPADKNGRSVVDLDLLDAGDGLVIIAEGPNDRLGWTVEGNIDVNGDGADDIQIGAPLANGGEGALYTLYGQAVAAESKWQGLAAASALDGTGELAADWLQPGQWQPLHLHGDDILL